ncbi:MAG: SDR family NAD(P)-dependent oxidoreductase [Caldilineaceae bacterium]
MTGDKGTGDKVTGDKGTSNHPITRSPGHLVTLSNTAVTQPALFVIEYALAKLWEAWGVQPLAMIGHSIGEYVAATLAGVFTLPDALALVAERGKLMQALPAGAMVAVSLSEEAIQPWLTADVALAAVNGPERLVVAGPFPAIDALEERLTAQAIPHRRLHTSHAFHSPMMEPILATFTARVNQVQRHAPRQRYLSNVTGRWITAAEATDPAYWARHLRQAVRFGDGVATLLQEGDPVLLEVGPGRTLSLLVSQHPAYRPTQATLASLPHPQQADAVNDAAFLLTTLGQLWLQGVHIDWEAFFAAEGQPPRRRVPLPTYPFERQRYWVDGAPSTRQSGQGQRGQTPTGKKANLEEWFYLPTWQRKPLLPHSRKPSPGVTLIFADESGLGEQLATSLRTGGETVAIVQVGDSFAQAAPGRYTLAPGDPAGYGLLLQQVQTTTGLPNRIVHLWSVSAPAATDEFTATAQSQELGFYSLLFLAQALGEQAATPCHLLVVSNNLQEVAGESWLAPAKATLLGPVTVIPQEFPHLTTQSIDLLLPTAAWQRDLLAQQLQQELFNGSEVGGGAEVDACVVAYRGQHRWARTFDAAPLPPAEAATLRLRQGGVYLITGGLGGIGLALAHDLAQSVQAKLILTSRTAFPPRAEWDAWLQRHAADEPTCRKIGQLQALEALGAELLVARADVADLAQMAQVVAEATARFGAIHGVIHAAGAPGDGMIQRKQRAVAAQVLAPKVQGTLVLAQLCDNLALDWLVLCSSLTAITGGLGQVDYCAANAFLDAFAQARTQQSGRFTLAINWDSWRETGMAVNAVPRFRPPAVAAVFVPTGAPHAVTHPLFAEGWREGEGQVRLISRWQVAEAWVLHEHRLFGQATLPATAYLELARAAFVELTQQPLLEVRDLFLLQPLTVADDASVEVHTLLTQAGDGWQFVIQSRQAGSEWQEHARGEVVALAASAPMYYPLPVITADAALVPVTTGTNGDRRQSGPIEAGPRWQNFVTGAVEGTTGAARFTLAPRFVDDLRHYQLHPGLLDGATNFLTQPVLGDAYLPFAYERIRVYAPLPPTLISTMRLVEPRQEGADTPSFDILLLDEAGRRVVEINGYRLRKVAAPVAPVVTAAPAMAVASTQSHPPAGFTLDHGVTTAEGVELFKRALAQSFAQVLVSTQELAGEIARANQGPLLRASEPVAEPTAPLASTGQKARPALAQPYVAPRTELEQRIAQVWEAFLGVAPVGVDDDFFAFGGDSLMAIQITGRLSTALKQKLSPNQFLSAPTVAALAQALGRTAAADGAGGATPSTSLVNLHTGQAQHSPLFLIHPVGGSIYHYRHLAQSLGAGQPVYAIQSPGLEGEQAPLTTVAAMAHHYLELVRSVQPQGPYRLGGWSLGGLVAFAMAQQLQAQGQPATLVMIDTFFPVTPATPLSDAHYAAHFARYMGDVVGKEFDLAVADLAQCDGEARVQLLVSEGRRRGVLPADLAVEQIRQRLAVYTANFRAMDHYTPQPYSGAVTFLASADSVQRSGEVTLGWASVLTGTLTMATLPGNHYSIIDSPAVTAALRSILSDNS